MQKHEIKTNYKLQGSHNNPILIFSHSLGNNMSMWDELVAPLLPYFRVLQYDTRGHGDTNAPYGFYSIKDLGEDLIELMDKLSIETASFCGLSLGGLIGQWLGIHHPERFDKLIISNTAAKIGDAESWDERSDTIQLEGMESILDQTLSVWFSDAFRQNHPEIIDRARKIFLNNNPTGYSGCCAAIRDADFREALHLIKPETLVITGEDDPVTTPEDARFLVANIPQAELKLLPGRHILAQEIPAQYIETILDFLVGKTDYERGMHIKKIVLGSEQVQNEQKHLNDFSADFQQLEAEVPWGNIWNRPGLSRHQRSLITLAMLIAQNRKDAFKVQLKAALNNGVTVEEVKEIILQSAVYCGFPIANDAFLTAQEVILQEGIELET
jgi:3-oxoadipate enol-lactonase/4-carboxymuconolactone decarboxylase